MESLDKKPAIKGKRSKKTREEIEEYLDDMARYIPATVPVDFLESEFICAAGDFILGWMIDHKLPQDVITVFRLIEFSNMYRHEAVTHEGYVSKDLEQEAPEYVLNGLRALKRLGHKF